MRILQHRKTVSLWKEIYIRRVDRSEALGIDLVDRRQPQEMTAKRNITERKFTPEEQRGHPALVGIVYFPRKLWCDAIKLDLRM